MDNPGSDEEALSLADRAAQYSKQTGNGNITEHRAHLSEPEKDLAYFRRLALKALRRVFPGVDIETIAAAEVDALAQRLLTDYEETT